MSEPKRVPVSGSREVIGELRPVAVALGSNRGDRLANLRRAVQGIEQHLDGVRTSRVYETEPELFEGQGKFLNAAVTGFATVPPERLLAELQAIERRLGRRREGPRYGPRVIDLDLLLYADVVIRTAGLVLPHPRLTERAFVLVPLADVAAEWKLPPGSRAAGRTIGELAAEVDRTGVTETDESLSDGGA